MISWHDLISYGNGYSPWEVGEYQHFLLIRNRLNVQFYAIGDGDFSFMTQEQQDQLFLDGGRILYPPKDDMREISQKRCVHGGSDQSRKEALHGNSYANFSCCPQTKDIFINSSFVVQKHQERWREVCGEGMKKDGIHLFTNHLSKSKEEAINQYEDPSPKYLCGRELVVFGLIFFWCALNWEAMILGRAAHQLTNTNHDPFFQITTINHLIYFKVNLQGPNLVHGNVRRWILIHKWKSWLGLNSTSSLSCLKKEELSDDAFGILKTDFKKGGVIFIKDDLRYPSFERRDQLGVKKRSHPAIKICFQDLLPWKISMEEQHNVVLTELRTIPFKEGGNDTCMKVTNSKNENGMILAKWDGDVANGIMAKFVCMVT